MIKRGNNGRAWYKGYVSAIEAVELVKEGVDFDDNYAELIFRGLSLAERPDVQTLIRVINNGGWIEYTRRLERDLSIEG